MLTGIGKLFVTAALLLGCLTLRADELHLAVATNFSAPARLLATAFERHSGYRTVISTGSTGKLYAQIVNGAPYDIFLAADSRRPALLEAGGRTVPGSRRTYAFGRLALWSRESGYVPATGMPAAASYGRLAIANPELAPYGDAAREVLQNLGLWEQLEAKIVRGESIGQTYQFIASGNARLGFIAQSQLPQQQGSAWLVPEQMHTPIQQQLVMLKESTAARAFLDYLQQADARRLIRQSGYNLAENEHVQLR